jgi:hypothetical protein
MSTLHLTAEPTDRFLGRCDACVRPIAAELFDIARDTRSGVCPDCGAEVALERVYGTRTTMTCDPSCEGAVGPVCVCGCGGENHGGRFLRTGEALASAVADYRRAAEVRKAAAVKRSERAAAKRAASAAERADQAASEAEAFRADHVDLWAFLTAYAESEEYNEFYSSLREQWAAKGALSERQLDALTASIRRREAVAAQRAEEAVNAKPAPLGTQTIEGEVVMVREYDGFRGDGVWKMMVRCDGFKVFVTVPRALSESHWEACKTVCPYPSIDEWLVGKMVRFTAALELGRDNPDPSFAFAKRPRAVALVSEVAA